MDFTEKRKDSQLIFSGKLIKVRLDTVELPNGNEATREWVEHPGAVAVVAIDEEERIFLVRQYRYPVKGHLLEIPAGKLGPNEDPLDCAKRELWEETGISAQTWKLMHRYYTTPGFSDEVMYLYLAQDLSRGDSQPDDDEFVEVVPMPLKEAYSRLQKGEFQDSKTIIGILKAFILHEMQR